MNVNVSSTPLKRTASISAIIAIACGGIANAGNIWDGGGGDNNWGTGDNWSPGGNPSPGPGNDLFFAGTARLTPFNNYTAFDDWKNIIFNSGAGSFNITGDAIDLFGKIENQSVNGQTVGFGSIALNSNNNNEFNPLNGDLTITSTNIFTNGNQLKVFGANGFTLSFASVTNIGGAGSVAINQNSTVIYNGAHSYSGDTFVNAGKLQFNSGGSANSSSIRIGDTSGNSNAQLDLIAATGGQTLSNTIESRAGTSGVRTLNSKNSNGVNTLSGSIILNAALTLTQAAGGTLNLSGGTTDLKGQTLTVDSNGSVTIPEALSSSFGAGGSLVKQGSGILVLSNTSNNYTGTNSNSLNGNGTQVAGGTLGIHGDGSLGIAPAGAYNNIQFTGSGTLQNTANNISLNANRNIKVANSATATFDNNGNTFTINGVINGSGGSVATSGSGSVVFSGANSYTGTTTVSGGTLIVNGNQSNATGDITVATTATLKGSGTIGGATTINGIHAPGNNGVGQQTISNTLNYGATSIFEWEIDVTGDTTAVHDSVLAGALSGSNAEFRILLAGGDSFAAEFWNSTRNWTAATLFGATNAAVNLTTIFNDTNTATNFAANPLEGQFSFTDGGSTLTWTAVPEPSSALAGLLLAAGLLRRKRNA